MNEHEIAEKCGIDLSQFKHYGHRGNSVEYHGPCWKCGGEDRMCIMFGPWRDTKYGSYVCRVCRVSGSLDKLMGKKAKILSKEEYLELRRKANEQRKRDEEQKKARAAKMARWLNGGVVDKLHANLLSSQEHLEMLDKDGISMEIIWRWKIGFNPKFRYKRGKENVVLPAFAFPIHSLNGKGYVNVRMRIIGDPKNKYRPITWGLGTQFFYAVYPDDQTLYVVEGEKKAMVLHSHGLSTIGLLGAQNFKPEWVRYLRTMHSKFLILLDERDNPGVYESAHKVANMLNGIVVWGDNTSKPDDFLVKYGLVPFLKSLRKE